MSILVINDGILYGDSGAILDSIGYDQPKVVVSKCGRMAMGTVGTLPNARQKKKMLAFFTSKLQRYYETDGDAEYLKISNEDLESLGYRFFDIDLYLATQEHIFKFVAGHKESVLLEFDFNVRVSRGNGADLFLTLLTIAQQSGRLDVTPQNIVDAIGWHSGTYGGGNLDIVNLRELNAFTTTNDKGEE